MSEEHRTSEEKRAPLLPEPVRNPGWPAPVGFDIETTGVGPDDIVTVACVWSPDREAACFYGDDFGPVLEMLDQAPLIHTYNGVEFDLPRLAKHCGREMGPWLKKTVDPLFLMKHSMGYGACKKLNDMLISNGFEPKTGSGLQAIEQWKNRELDALKSYCMDDARLTYSLCEMPEIRWGLNWVLKMREANVLSFVQ